MGLHLYSPVRCFTIYSPLRPVPRVQEQAIFLRCMMGAGPLVSRDRGMVPRLAPSRPAPPAPLPHIYISCACDKRDQRGRAPSPTLAPTDPVPAGPRTAGRLRTRHLARKFGNLDAQNTWGSHTPPSLPFFACVILSPRSGAAWEAGDAQADPPATSASQAWEAAASRVWVSAAGTVHGRCASRPASDLAIAMGCPGQPGNCGGRHPRCRATAVLPPSGILAKMRSGEKGDILVRALSALPSVHPEVTDTRGPFLRARA